MDDDFVEMRKSELRQQGDDAFQRQDYVDASACYTQAVRVDPYDAELFSNRSLCWLHTGDGKRALYKAEMCKMLCPKWPKAYYLQGKALVLLKEYVRACEVLSSGLDLDPENDEIYKLYWESMELKNAHTGAT
ncbi:hypothetical protein ACP4OV_008716 [Aristida adscensionis]